MPCEGTFVHRRGTVRYAVRRDDCSTVPTVLGVGNGAVRTICSFIENVCNPGSMSTLRLALGCHVDDTGCFSIARAVSRVLGLYTLHVDLSSNLVTDHGLYAIATVLHTDTHTHTHTTLLPRRSRVWIRGNALSRQDPRREHPDAGQYDRRYGCFVAGSEIRGAVTHTHKHRWHHAFHLPRCIRLRRLHLELDGTNLSVGVLHTLNDDGRWLCDRRMPSGMPSVPCRTHCRMYAWWCLRVKTPRSCPTSYQTGGWLVFVCVWEPPELVHPIPLGSHLHEEVVLDGTVCVEQPSPTIRMVRLQDV